MPFADELIGVQTAQTLADTIGVAAQRPVPALRAAAGQLGPLALRERADLLREALLADVAGEYAELAQVVRTALRDVPEFTGWLIWPVSTAVAGRAVAAGTGAAFDDAMALLSELTGRLTCEFAIRVLLRENLDRALEIARGWTAADDASVRRLASEGTRPYLPWALRVPGIIADPGVTLPILDALCRDPDEVVRRSVANHLNDLSRDHPALVVQTARGWLAEPGPDTARLVRHALRTLIKRGDPDALALLGFDTPSVAIEGLAVDRAVVPMGESVRVSAVVRNLGERPAKLAIDYVVHHRKANGTLAPKTFKLTTATLAPGQSVDIGKDHSFRPITTRRYYPGRHAIGLQVNGVASERVEFDLQ